jgi:hypothetical protein
MEHQLGVQGNYMMVMMAGLKGWGKKSRVL